MVPGVDFDEVAVLVGSKSGAIADNVKTRQVDQRHLVPSGAAGGGAGGIFVRLRDKADEVLRIQMGWALGFGVATFLRTPGCEGGIFGGVISSIPDELPTEISIDGVRWEEGLRWE